MLSTQEKHNNRSRNQHHTAKNPPGEMCIRDRRHISFYLNEHGVPSPTAYRRAKGLPVSSTSDDPMWGDRVVWNILTNPIYTGDLVQGRRRVKSYKVHEDVYKRQL